MAYKQLRDIKAVDVSATIEVAGGETSDWYGMPNSLNAVGMSLIPAGTAKVEFTLDAEGAKDDTAVAIEWPQGEVTENTNDLARNIAAIRLVSVSGAATLHLRVNR